MTYALSLSNVTKTYSNGFQAVKGIDLNVAKGEFYALLGPNGAGKSTTIGMIAGLVGITSGQIQVFSHDVQKQRSKASKLIGVMPQEVNLSIFETPNNIMRSQASYYGLSYREAKGYIEVLLKEARLWDRRHDQARNLSGGMKRRLMIARSMVHNPKVLILDEPTAGVDLEIRQGIWRFIKRMNKEHGLSIILTTHYLEEAEQLCDKIAIIKEGVIAADMKKAELLSQLEVQRIEFSLANPVPYRPLLDGVKLCWHDDVTLDVCLSRTQTLGDIICRLGNAGINVASVNNKANRLEQYYLSLVSEGGAHECN